MDASVFAFKPAVLDKNSRLMRSHCSRHLRRRASVCFNAYIAYALLYIGIGVGIGIDIGIVLILVLVLVLVLVLALVLVLGRYLRSSGGSICLQMVASGIIRHHLVPFLRER